MFPFAVRERKRSSDGWRSPSTAEPFEQPNGMDSLDPESDPENPVDPKWKCGNHCANHQVGE